MQICTKCKEPKTLTEYRFANKATGKRTCWCKVCFSAHERERAIRYKNNREKMKEYLSGRCCKHCGIDDIRVLEFDHIDRQTKKYDISVMMGNSWETIMEEVAKCQILCANCHRIKTHENKDWSSSGRKESNLHKLVPKTSGRPLTHTPDDELYSDH